jgi:hypothetical protein
MNDVERLGGRLAGIEDEALVHDRSVEAGRALFAASLAGRGGAMRSRARPGRWLAAAAAAALVLVAGAALWMEPGGKGTIAVGRWLRAPADEALAFDFGGGSSLVLAPRSQARVTSGGPRRAEVVLERGSVFLDVEPAPDNRWRVFGGPYEIRVTGTRFDTAWKPEAASLRVEVFEGAVVVTGPLVPDGQRVAAGHVFTADLAAGRVALERADAAPAGDAGNGASDGAGGDGDAGEEFRVKPDPPREGRDGAGKRDGRGGRVGGAAAEGPPDEPAWGSALRDGRHAEAVILAEGRGFAWVLAEATAGELFALGESARLSNRLDLAATAYIELRARFPGTGHAAAAALSLGRMAFDQGRDYAAAAMWLETYLGEASDTSLAREALGRLMEARQRAGDALGAAAAARRYLELHPDGPHAGLARQIAGTAP